MIPVFAAEITATGEFKPFDFRRVTAALPHVQHARQASASHMIAELRYLLLLSLLSPSLLTDTSTVGARFHRRRQNFSIASQIPWRKYLLLFLVLFLLLFLFLLLLYLFLSYLRRTSDCKKDIQAEWGVHETKRRGQGGTGRPRSKGNASHAEVRLTHHRSLPSSLSSHPFPPSSFSFPSSPPLPLPLSSPLFFLPTHPSCFSSLLCFPFLSF